MVQSSQIMHVADGDDDLAADDEEDLDVEVRRPMATVDVVLLVLALAVLVAMVLLAARA